MESPDAEYMAEARQRGYSSIEAMRQADLNRYMNNAFTQGFEDCKRKVLAILAGHEEAMFLDIDMRNLVFGDISRLKAIE